VQLARICELNIEGKTRVMRNDPREQRDGLVLELGHTVGHALELLAQLRHGFAIGIGLCIAARVGRLLGWLDESAEGAHYALLVRNGAPTRLPNGAPEQVLGVVAGDNKRGRLPVKPGHHVRVVLERLGRPRCTVGLPLVHIPEEVLHAALRQLASTSRASLRVLSHQLWTLQEAP
jgi:3-dehydroquinate synthase